MVFVRGGQFESSSYYKNIPKKRYLMFLSLSLSDLFFLFSSLNLNSHVKLEFELKSNLVFLIIIYL